MTHMTLQAVRQLIANDSYAITFQSVEQYRATLLRHVDSLVNGTQQYASGGTVPAELRLAGEGLHPFSSPAVQQAAAPGALTQADPRMLAHFTCRHDPDACGGEGLYFTKMGADGVYQLYRNEAEALYLNIGAALAAAPSAPGTPEAPQTAAARDVLAERQRQVGVEGWAPERDDCYVKEELRAAALCYMRWKDITKPGIPPGAWPWNTRWWKPADDRRNLVKATALMLAEIERLDRAAQLDTAPEAPKGGA